MRTGFLKHLPHSALLLALGLFLPASALAQTPNAPAASADAQQQAAPAPSALPNSATSAPTQASPAAAAPAAAEAQPSPGQQTAAPAGPVSPPREDDIRSKLPHDLSPWGMFLSADVVVKAVMIGLALASLLTWWLAKSIELLIARRRLRAGTDAPP